MSDNPTWKTASTTYYPPGHDFTNRGDEPPNLTAALAYAARGWHVFPANLKDGKKSFKAERYSGTKWGASRDPRIIAADWLFFQQAQVGVVTGGKSGMFVLEADTKAGHDVDGIASLQQLQKRHGPLPPTLEAESPSGSVHYYFQHPGGKVKNSASELAPGVDVRGDGGMVIAPPSVRGDGAYRWRNALAVAEAPAWLTALVTERPRNVVDIRTGEALSDELVALATPDAGRGVSVDPADLPEPEPEGKLAAALAAASTASNPNLGWEEWNNRGMKFYAATGGSAQGLAAFERFSRQSSKYLDPKETAADRWRAYGGSPPKQFTVASLYQMADEGDPAWRDQLHSTTRLGIGQDLRGIFQEPEPELHPEADAETDETDDGSWWRDPATIPPRPFLHGKHYQRKTVGATMADGGRAKTTKLIYEAVSMALGYDPKTGEVHVSGPLRVAILNGEEDQDELDRRVAATVAHYKIAREHLGGRLHVRSLKRKPEIRYVAAMSRGGPVLNKANVQRMQAYVVKRRIDVLIVDPLVKFHSLPEGDNVAMDFMITNAFGSLAEATEAGLHVELSHHTRKLGPGQQEATVDDGRGASAVKDAVRSARVMNFMTSVEAKTLGVTEKERRRYVRTTNGKANAGPMGTADFMRLEVVQLVNGDEVAVAEPWRMASAFEGVTMDDTFAAVQLAEGGKYRADPRSTDWFGYALGKHLKMRVTPGKDRSNPGDLAKLKAIINTWIRNGVLAVEARQDDKQRRAKEFIVPGPNQPSQEEMDLV